jgi:outer membrane protein, multidrug efflux system
MNALTWRAPCMAALAGCVALIAGCKVGPDYRTPDVAVPREYVGPSEPDQRASFALAAANESDLSQWWQQFHDPQLQSLIARALEANLDLQSAASRIRQARTQEIIAGAAALPSINVVGLGAYTHSNSNLLSTLSGTSVPGQPNRPQTNKLFVAGFDATWELDIFGGARRGIEAAQASSEAAAWQYRDAEVSLSAEVAVDYLTLCATRTRMAVVRDAIRRQEDTLALTEARRGAGFITELDVNQQLAQLAATRAQLPALEAQARAMIHALGVLLAHEPNAIAAELDSAAQLPPVPTTFPVGLPSDLLRRRPDIRQAERVLASSTAQIGVAVADLYPRFNLFGAVAFVGNSAGSLLSSRNLAEVGGGLIQWPLFQGGRIRANIHAKEEQSAQAYLSYQKSVLVALQDAEDALARFGAEQRRLAALQDSQRAAISSLEIARSQYENGVVSFINVLDADTTLLNVQDQIAQSQLALAQYFVSLYKAVGGGWST